MARIHRFSVGDFACVALQDNVRILDIETEFPQIPAAELRLALQATGFSDTQVAVGYNCLLVQTATYQILIDAGTGQDQLVASLKLASLEPADIDYLILTHSDFDHVGGLGLFPDAKIIMPRIAWDFWTIASERQRMVEEFVQVFETMLEPDFLQRAIAYRHRLGTEVFPALRERIQLIEPGEVFLPGVQMHYFPGHRTDHFAVEIVSAGQTLIHVADSFRHCLQSHHPRWYSVYDSWPDQWTASLSKLLRLIREKEALVFGSHLSFPGLARWQENGLLLTEN